MFGRASPRPYRFSGVPLLRPSHPALCLPLSAPLRIRGSHRAILTTPYGRGSGVCISPEAPCGRTGLLHGSGLPQLHAAALHLVVCGGEAESGGCLCFPAPTLGRLPPHPPPACLRGAAAALAAAPSFPPLRFGLSVRSRFGWLPCADGSRINPTFPIRYRPTDPTDPTHPTPTHRPDPPPNHPTPPTQPPTVIASLTFPRCPKIHD